MKTLSTCAFCVLALSACSDVNDAGSALRSRALYDYPDYPDVPPPGPSRGTLLQDPPELRGVVSASSLLFQLGTEATRQLLLLDASLVCDVVVYRLRYSTVGGTDESTTASGALMVPTGGDARCTGARPALLYAHEVEIDGRPARIIHRDVTPSNILLSNDGAIRLADFGIAKAASHGHHTRTGIVKGKVPYMPPEQALGENMDHRVDLFALGVVLFEALAGRPPFSSTSAAAVLDMQQHHEPPDLRTLRRDVAPGLALAIHRALAKKRDDRWQTAAAMRDALLPFTLAP